MFSIDIHKLGEQFLYDPKAPMIFNSGFFLFLFFGFVIIYTLLQKTDRPKLIFVTLFSLYFYYKSSGLYFLLILLTTAVDFSLAHLISRTPAQWRRTVLVTMSLLVNLGMLAYFKYTNFLHEIFSNLAGLPYRPLDIFLPVGISFFTFQSLSYTIDVYRGHLKPVANILDYAFFVTFFPQLVAGPIVRAADFLPQIHQPTIVTRSMFGRGIFLITTGLFKKAVISDYISLNFVDRIFDAPLLYSGIENLFGLYGYALQIYCDFSGYSDMAIGIALLLGFQFKDNFNSPYKAANITEFWRRWHISLSTWLRDYLYISLGGNRKGKIRTYINLLITMLLGGLWHGASFRFILWGGLHGAALAVNKAFSQIKFPALQNNMLKRSLKIGSIIFTFHFVCFCWIFFRASNMEIANNMLTQIFSNFKGGIFLDLIRGYQGVFILMGIGFILHFIPKHIEMKAENWMIKIPLVGKAAVLLTTILLVIQTKSAGIQPFIYFQF